MRRGVNSQLDTIQASVLSGKLGFLDDWNPRREKTCAEPVALGHADHKQVVDVEPRFRFERKPDAGIAQSVAVETRRRRRPSF